MVLVPGFSLAQQLRASTLDVVAKLTVREPMLPPLSMRKVVGEPQWDLRGRAFQEQGKNFIDALRTGVGISASSRFFDLGSGCGRHAVPLTSVLNPNGSYVGLEPIKTLVRWCRREITSRFPNFDFVHCDVFNSVYNRSGRSRAEDYRFPFADASFDRAIATSVFTHLPEPAAANYLRETARVMTRGGLFWASFYLLDQGSRSGDGVLDFVHSHGVARSVSPKRSEWAVAFPSSWVLQTAAAAR